MACTATRSEQIGDLCTGRAAAEVAEDLLPHLEDCAECSQEFEEATRLVALAEADPAAFDEPVRLRLRVGWQKTVAALAAAAILLSAWLWSGSGSGTGAGGEGTAEAAILALAQIEALPGAQVVLRSGRIEEQDELHRQARSQYAERNFQAAAAAFEKALAQHPDDALSLLYLGICRLQLDQAAQAAVVLQGAVEGGARLVSETAQWYLAQAHLRHGEAQAALVVLRALRERRGDWELNAEEQIRQLEELLPEID